MGHRFGWRRRWRRRRRRARWRRRWRRRTKWVWRRTRWSRRASGRAVDRVAQIPGVGIARVGARAEEIVLVRAGNNRSGQREHAGLRCRAVDRVDDENTVAGGQRAATAGARNRQHRISSRRPAVDHQPVRRRAVVAEERVEADRSIGADVVPGRQRLEHAAAGGEKAIRHRIVGQIGDVGIAGEIQTVPFCRMTFDVLAVCAAPVNSEASAVRLRTAGLSTSSETSSHVPPPSTVARVQQHCGIAAVRSDRWAGRAGELAVCCLRRLRQSGRAGERQRARACAGSVNRCAVQIERAAADYVRAK